MNSLLIFLFLATLNTISQSYVEGLRSSDKYSFGPKPKGTIKTIDALEFGDIIDCVDFYKQPAFDNPLIKDLKIKPNSHLSAFNTTSNHQPGVMQAWNKFGECPEGTIPIRRTSNNNITNYRKSNYPNVHEYATVVQYFNKSYGGKAFLSTWEPRVQHRKEFSLSQLWVSAGSGEEKSTAEAGWMVYPNLFHDSRSRLFTYWSRKNYEEGCHNLDCPGFVHTSRRTALGATVEPVSIYGGRSMGIHVGLERTQVGDWNLQVRDDVVGFFPRQVVTTLGNGADLIAFGGEVINLARALGGPHSTTAMGSGHFSAEGFRRASYVSNIQVMNENSEWVTPDLQVQQITRPTCYDLAPGPPDTSLGTHFYFGGPGFSHQCQ